MLGVKVTAETGQERRRIGVFCLTIYKAPLYKFLLLSNDLDTLPAFDQGHEVH